MDKATGFMEWGRKEVGRRPVNERINDYREIDIPLSREVLVQQAMRCMDCGIPFCHGTGCPVRNLIPEFNHLVYQGRWRDAAEVLHSTNNFPEITGRVCPAPCEPACVLAMNQDPVLIKHIELQIVERAWSEGWIVPQPALQKSGRRVAVVGSGPAGLAAAQQLARAGHEVTVFEKEDRIGGLLRYGIPDFKLDRSVLDRRLAQLRAEGVQFRTEVNVGVDISIRYLRKMYSATLVSIGARQPRDLDIPGRAQAENVHFAMDYLTQQNRIVAGDPVEPDRIISAKDKIVVVLGGGDTGSDCIGTANRQGASMVHQLEILPRPAEANTRPTPWPNWPQVLRTSSSHEEGCRRIWSVLAKKLTRNGDRVAGLDGVEIEWRNGSKGPAFEEVAGTEFSIKVDMILIAMGFLHVEHKGLIDHIGLALDERGNIATDENYMTSVPGIFAAGDSSLGASLVVSAIFQGREAAAAIDHWLNNNPPEA